MACNAGYFYGRQAGREAALKKDVSAYQIRGRINYETESLNPSALCRALGGERDECQSIGKALK